MVYFRGLSGDTLVYHRIDLYSLSQGLSLEDNGYLFNKTNVSYNQNNHLGSVSIRPTPGYRNELHETRLPDEWGKKWFNLMLKMTNVWNLKIVSGLSSKE